MSTNPDIFGQIVCDICRYFALVEKTPTQNPPLPAPTETDQDSATSNGHDTTSRTENTKESQ